MEKKLKEKLLKEKKKTEALLFATNQGFGIEEISERVGTSKNNVRKILNELSKTIVNRESALEIILPYLK